MTSLVIVESPNKVRSIAGYLGDGYVVDSSVGHIRDLPRGADEVPAKYKGEPWARLGVDIDNAFEPVYVVSADKKSQITKLKKLLKDADELVLATDEDREGEAIAWHLFDELKPTVPVKRIVFHEITREAILHAVANPRDIDMDLVDAQETRRILDRLYGYEVSPVLWKKVMSGLSAGRVQSVATRLVVERERARMAFRSASYWDLEATFDAGEQHEPRTFPSRLITVDGKRVATGSSFGDDGNLKGTDVVHLDEERAGALAAALADQTFTIGSVEAKPYTRKPYPPFRTTTMQQEASRKFGFGAARTMQVAQRLYEGGYITYMRTDSATLSQTALNAARSQVRELYGAEYLPDAPRTYAGKVKNAQEAHEAIRPAGESFRTPREVTLSGDEAKLYELIWKRTIASQMKDAKGETVTLRITADATSGESVEFTSSGRTITFHGFLKAYVESGDDPNQQGDDQQVKLPNVAQGDTVTVDELGSAGHQTKPPARFTEASLIKELEEREIGRPSTYASIIGTIQNRGYVYKKGTALVPAWIAFSVVRLMEQHFRSPGRLRLHRRARGRPRRGRRRTRGARRRPAELLDRCGRARHRPQDADREPARHRRPEPGHVRDRRGHQPAGRALWAVRRGPADAARRRWHRRADPRQRPGRPATGRAHHRPGEGAARQPVRAGEDPRHAPGDRPRAGRQERALRSVHHRAAAPRTRRRAPRPRTASLFESMTLDSIGLDDAVKLLGCHASSAPTSTARRSPRRTAATARTSRRAATRGRCRPRTSSSPSPRTRRAPSTPSPRRTDAVARLRPRSRSSATTR